MAHSPDHCHPRTIQLAQLARLARLARLLPLLPLLGALTGCTAATPAPPASATPPRAVTRLATVVVTATLPPTPRPNTTPLLVATVTPWLTPTWVAIDKPTIPDQGSAYYEGAAVLGGYIYLRQQGLYGPAYDLTCAASQEIRSREDSIEFSAAIGIYRAEILKIEPYTAYLQRTGQKPQPDTQETPTSKWFMLRLYLEGKGGMAGAVPNGYYDYRGNVIWEDDGWKVCGLGK